MSDSRSEASAGTSALPVEFDDPKYRARRAQNWLLVGFLYAFFYMTRYNYTASSAQLGELVGWTKGDLSIFETVLPLVYGLSVFFNGPLADRIGGKKAFLIGAVGVVIANFAFGGLLSVVHTPAVWAKNAAGESVLVSSAVLGGGFNPKSLLATLAAIWGVNGYFQSFGALAIVKVNAQWFHVKERGSFSGVFGVLIRFGLILAFSVVPLLTAKFGLRAAFWVPGAAVAVLFILNSLLVENSPQEAGFPPVDVGEGGGADDGAKVDLLGVLKKVFASPAAWFIAVGSMMIGMVRRSVVDAWWPNYFAETFSVSKKALGTFAPYQTASIGIALVGILGGFAFGISSDKIFGSRRAPVIVVGFVGMAVMLGLFGAAHHLHLGPWAAAACLMLLSFFVNGAHGMIGGAASMDFGGRKAAATAAGLFDGMQYLAAAFVGRFVGFILDHKGWGWSVWPFAPIPFAIAGAIVVSFLWNATPRGRAGH